MIGVGIAWASILSMPYAILSGAVPGRKMGVYMGIFNIFIVVPQLVAATILGLILKSCSAAGHLGPGHRRRQLLHRRRLQPDGHRAEDCCGGDERPHRRAALTGLAALPLMAVRRPRLADIPTLRPSGRASGHGLGPCGDAQRHRLAAARL
jgi:MFS family permease